MQIHRLGSARQGRLDMAVLDQLCREENIVGAASASGAHAERRPTGAQRRSQIGRNGGGHQTRDDRRRYFPEAIALRELLLNLDVSGNVSRTASGHNRDVAAVEP